MEIDGFRPFDFLNSRLSVGDFFVSPYNNSHLVYPLNDNSLSLYGKVSPTTLALASITHAATGAGFYADQFGPLPFVFGFAPKEQYWIMKVSQQ